jgi:hypothetical protein
MTWPTTQLADEVEFTGGDDQGRARGQGRGVQRDRPTDLVTTTEGQGRPALRGWSGSALGAIPLDD